MNKILIICEGNEEYWYIKKLLSLKVWSSSYKIDLKNAKGMDNIFAHYQNTYSNGSYKAIFIYCDTEMYPYDKFMLLKENIGKFHNKKSIIDKIIIFVNPCTLLIILLHFIAGCRLKTNKKSSNSIYIKDLFGIIEYRAKEKELERIMRDINQTNYMQMKTELLKLSKDYEILNSTNFSSLLEKLESNDISWLKKYQKI